MGRPKENGTSPQLSLRVSADLKQRLKKLADADRRKLGDYARIVLEEHLKKADAETGDFASNASTPIEIRTAQLEEDLRRITEKSAKR